MNEKQIEAAARAYAVNMGENPDEIIGHEAGPNKHGFVPAVMLCSPRWKFYVGKVKSCLAMQAAIDAASKI